MNRNIRKAVLSDAEAIAIIYNEVITKEENGPETVGWKRNIYPTIETAEAAIHRGDMFVLEDDVTAENGTIESRIVGTGIINQIQVDVYEGAPWLHDTDQVCVLHTLAISPKSAGKGMGKAFVAFYENWAREHGLQELRMDTNVLNLPARAMYKKLGYKEIAIVPTTFNGIKGVDLVLLEKHLDS